MNMTLVRALVAEAIGTFILVLIGSMAIVSGGAEQLPPLLTAPFGFGLGLLAAIVIFGHVSGGHFNPAVTLGALFDGRINVVGAIGYWIAQVIGAIGASLMIEVTVNQGVVAATMTAGAVGDGQAFAVEAILTAILVAVVLTVTAREPRMAPLVMALTLTAIYFAAIPVSGASFNPARSLGPAIVAGKVIGGPTGLWVYLAGPMLGGLIGWGLYRFFALDDEEELEEAEDEDEDEDEDTYDDELEDEPGR